MDINTPNDNGNETGSHNVNLPLSLPAGLDCQMLAQLLITIIERKAQEVKKKNDRVCLLRASQILLAGSPDDNESNDGEPKNKRLCTGLLSIQDTPSTSESDNEQSTDAVGCEENSPSGNVATNLRVKSIAKQNKPSSSTLPMEGDKITSPQELDEELLNYGAELVTSDDYSHSPTILSDGNCRNGHDRAKVTLKRKHRTRHASSVPPTPQSARVPQKAQLELPNDKTEAKNSSGIKETFYGRPLIKTGFKVEIPKIPLERKTDCFMDDPRLRTTCSNDSIYGCRSAHYDNSYSCDEISSLDKRIMMIQSDDCDTDETEYQVTPTTKENDSESVSPVVQVSKLVQTSADAFSSADDQEAKKSPLLSSSTTLLLTNGAAQLSYSKDLLISLPMDRSDDDDCNSTLEYTESPNLSLAETLITEEENFPQPEKESPPFNPPLPPGKPPSPPLLPPGEPPSSPLLPPGESPSTPMTSPGAPSLPLGDSLALPQPHPFTVRSQMQVHTLRYPNPYSVQSTVNGSYCNYGNPQYANVLPPVFPPYVSTFNNTLNQQQHPAFGSWTNNHRGRWM